MKRWQLESRLRQSTCVGVAAIADGTNFVDVRMFNDDPKTEGILMAGEIGGDAEESRRVREGASKSRWRRSSRDKPRRRANAWPCRRVISGGSGAASDKIALRAANILVADSPAELGTTLKRR